MSTFTYFICLLGAASFAKAVFKAVDVLEGR